MFIKNPPKMYVVLLALICITVLLLSRSIEPEAGLGLIGLIVGYGVGNGIAARNHEPVDPIFSDKTKTTPPPTAGDGDHPPSED